MIRQARTYFVGAMSGATLIAIAIAVFVLLVSATVFRDWPLAALGGDDSAAVSDARPTDTDNGPASPGSAAGDAGDATAAAGGGDRGGDGDGALAAVGDGDSPGAATETGGDEEQGSGSGGGGDAGGGGSGSGAQPSGQGGSGSSSGGGSGGGGSGGGGGGSGGGGGAPEPATSTSGKVTETVNNTVNQVDQAATGGVLQETGVTGVTEDVVNGVVGPESVVGKVVDGVVDTVGGILGGKK